MSVRIEADIAVMGGGIGGLWTLHALWRAGYKAVLVSRGALGAGQTIASQGIIHGGIKYALTGSASAASKAIAGMPGLWQACLEGRVSGSDEGEGVRIDLRAAEVLSRGQYLWTTTGIGSKLMGVAASKVVRTPMERVTGAELPAAFRRAPRGVQVYRVAESVLEPRSLVMALAKGMPVVDESKVEVRAGWKVWCAGAGNPERLTQRRPLHMVMVRDRRGRPEGGAGEADAVGGLPRVYGHCVGGGLSDKPRLTMTSQRDAAGRMVWYLGGQIAETGVERTETQQIEEAKREVAACAGWMDVRDAEWATLRVDRAERMQNGGGRPDLPVVEMSGEREIAAWPTKLAFAPLMAAEVVRAVQSAGIERNGTKEGVHAAVMQHIERERVRASVAELPWNEAGVVWN